jgi:hypothetical protein
MMLLPVLQVGCCTSPNSVWIVMFVVRSFTSLDNAYRHTLQPIAYLLAVNLAQFSYIIATNCFHDHFQTLCLLENL